MAGRPPKQGIDFAGWDVNIFDDDRKIDKLLESRGAEGFVIYFFLCQRAYGSHGYFYPWSYDDAPTTAKKIGGAVGSESVINTVNLCFHIGLFDKNLYDRHEIITSRGIQKRFCQAIKKRPIKIAISEYWLLEKSEECEGLVKVALNGEEMPIKGPEMPIYGEEMPITLPHNDTKERKVKDSIVKDSIGENTGEPPPAGVEPPEKSKKPTAKDKPQKHHHGEYKNVLLTDEELQRLVADYGEERVIAAVKHFDEYIEMKGYKAKNHNLAIRKWVFRALDEEAQRDRRAHYAEQRSGNIFYEIGKEKGYFNDD